MKHTAYPYTISTRLYSLEMLLFKVIFRKQIIKLILVQQYKDLHAPN